MAKAKITLKNIKKFVTGWSRWFMYKLTRSKYLKGFSEFNFLPTYQQEQFQYRLAVMNKECLDSGKCVICGCKTPQLQLADEACEGFCYPDMMEEKAWTEYKRENTIIV